MKKVFLVFVMVLGAALTVSAQPRAIGARLGYNFEASYQHYLGNNFMEIDAGLNGWYSGIQATIVYDFVFATPEWTSEGEWNFYAGPGVHWGYRWFDRWQGPSSPYYGNWTDAFVVGLAGQIGMSYTFWFPLQLSFDYRPVFGAAIGKYAGHYNLETGQWANARFYKTGLFDFALSARYAF